VLTGLRVLPFLLLIISFFLFPQEVLSSASAGLTLWVNYVLPALFPFFIVSDFLLKQGFVHFLGALLEPLMRPLFRLPGKASFVIAMTHTAGIPIGAILTCKMRQQGEISRLEGERLLAFTSNPSPAFMLGAVATGMLGKPAFGLIIAGSVYIANLIVGLLFRFYGQSSPLRSKSGLSLRQAWREMENAQKKNNKPLGAMLGEAVRESISTILLVGGFIVLFSVVSHLLLFLGISTKLAQGLAAVSGGLLSVAGGSALIQGLLETTLGCQAVVPAFSALNAQVGILAFILGWGGLSVFAQVASFTAATDLRFFPFFLGRVCHAFLALLISQILLLISDLPTMPFFHLISNPWLYTLRWSMLYFTLGFASLLLIGFILLLTLKSRKKNI